MRSTAACSVTATKRQTRVPIRPANTKRANSTPATALQKVDQSSGRQLVFGEVLPFGASSGRTRPGSCPSLGSNALSHR